MNHYSLLAFVALFSACGGPLSEAELDEVDEAAPEGQTRTKDQGGPNGDFNYCDGITPCEIGEGDCDSDDQCAAGLVCGVNNGGQFDLHWSRDVCVEAGCTDGVQNGAETGVDIGGTCGGSCGGGENGANEGYCTAGCPCEEGEGDCDTDAECAEGLVCVSNRDGAFGPPLDPSDSVCTGSPGALGIADLQVGDLVVTEIMNNPDAVTDTAGEWFEIFNTTNSEIELNGLQIRKTALGAVNFTVGASLVIQPNGYLTFARNGNGLLNGGVTEDFDYINTFALGNTADSIVLDNGPLEIDRVVWNAAFPHPVGHSMQVALERYDAVDNNAASNWCASRAPMSGGDEGTPGTDNRTCAGELPVDLGTAEDFVILAKSAVSTVPNSAVTGDIGLSPAAGTFITGFSLTMDATNEFSTSTQVTGRLYAADYAPPTPQKMTTAVGDMQTAFTDAAGRAAGVTELGAGDIGGMTLLPGVYSWGTGLLIPADLTLDGGPDEVWIFQIGQALTVTSGVRISLSGGARPENIFWQVSGLVDVGTTAHLEGIVLGQTSITLATGASVDGRLLAQTAVTIDTSTVVEP